MSLPFKHRYIIDEQITEKGIYYVKVKITYKGNFIFGKFVFCKKVIGRFEYNLLNCTKPLNIKQNSNDIVVIEISIIKYLSDTTV